MVDNRTRAPESADFDLAIRAAVVVLRAGGLVAFPTDTLYGLGADAYNAEAVERVFVAKGRDREHGLPVLIADASELSQAAAEVSPAARLLAERFWPGALTLVLPRSPDLPAIVSGGAATVAVRVPEHPVPVRIIRELGRALIGTSANRAGAPDPVTADEVTAQLSPWLDYVIDAGPAPRGEPSTIVDTTSPHPRVLREGAISADEIFHALEDLPTPEDPHEREPVV